MSEFLQGHWRSAIGKADAAAEMFGNRCVGVWWELDNARKIPLSALAWMGEVGQLRERLDVLCEEAAWRGNLNLLTNPNSSTLAVLGTDDVDQALTDLDLRMRHWSRDTKDCLGSCERLGILGFRQADDDGQQFTPQAAIQVLGVLQLE